MEKIENYATVKCCWRFGGKGGHKQFREVSTLSDYCRYLRKEADYSYKQEHSELLFGGHFFNDPSKSDAELSQVATQLTTDEIKVRWQQIADEERGIIKNPQIRKSGGTTSPNAVVATGWVFGIQNTVLDHLSEEQQQIAIVNLLRRFETIGSPGCELSFSVERSYGASGEENLHIHVITRQRVFHPDGRALKTWRTRKEFAEQTQRMRQSIRQWAHEVNPEITSESFPQQHCRCQDKFSVRHAQITGDTKYLLPHEKEKVARYHQNLEKRRLRIYDARKAYEQAIFCSIVQRKPLSQALSEKGWEIVEKEHPKLPKTVYFQTKDPETGHTKRFRFASVLKNQLPKEELSMNAQEATEKVKRLRQAAEEAAEALRQEEEAKTFAEREASANAQFDHDKDLMSQTQTKIDEITAQWTAQKLENRLLAAEIGEEYLRRKRELSTYFEKSPTNQLAKLSGSFASDPGILFASAFLIPGGPATLMILATVFQILQKRKSYKNDQILSEILSRKEQANLAGFEELKARIKELTQAKTEMAVISEEPQFQELKEQILALPPGEKQRIADAKGELLPSEYHQAKQRNALAAYPPKPTLAELDEALREASQKITEQLKSGSITKTQAAEVLEKMGAKCQGWGYLSAAVSLKKRGKILRGLFDPDPEEFALARC